MVTFDEGGVSGHPNHVDTYRGVLLCLKHLQAEADATTSTTSTTTTGEATGEQDDGRLLPPSPSPSRHLGIQFLKLHTTCLPRKYAGALDAVLTALLLNNFSSSSSSSSSRGMNEGIGGKEDDDDDDEGLLVVLNADVPTVYSAMAQHRSQFVWFRRAFVLLSRYTYINSLRAMK